MTRLARGAAVVVHHDEAAGRCVALQGKGDARAKDAFSKAASWNAFAPNYPFVRAKAKAMLAKS